MSDPRSILPTLPETSAGFADATLADIAPYYQALAAWPVTAESLDPWLRAWSRLDELVSEAASLAMIAYTCDTADPAKEAAHLRFSTEILPHLAEVEVAVARRFVAIGSADATLQTALHRYRTASEIFREANVARIAEAEGLAARYQQITGGMTAPWRGETLPLPRLAPFMKDTDRDVREAAWRAATAPYVAARDTLADVFDRMVVLRQEVAREAGFTDFRTYTFAAKCRVDYTPADCERLHDAIEAQVGPALERLAARRRERLGVATLRPWDMAVDPYRSAAPVPYRTVAEFQQVAARIFTEIDPVFGEQFGRMMAAEALDLESRPGKAPGGYCDTLSARGMPFVFMNAAGIPEDVTTLLHEAGHCFHAFAAHELPLLCQRHQGAESAELASMSMELLAAPYLARPTGYYDAADAAAVRLEHLEDVLIALGHIASVDAFQSWIYTDPSGGEAAARDRAWLALRERFEPGIDWSGLTAERVSRWYRQLHIFIYPFYYIEYAIAQIGALQVWRNARRDPAAAVAAYRRFMALGATRPLPDLYREAGIALTFDAGVLGELVALVEEEMDTLRGQLGA